jgi:glycosyltransferase involved in cell wall biosynthesis
MSVVQFIAADQGGCGWYRCVLPAAALRAAGVDASIAYGKLVTFARLPVPQRIISGVLDLAPVNVIQRPLRDAMLQVVESAIRQGARVWIELDDDFWSLPAHNPAAPYVGKYGVPNLTRCCQLAEGVIVSTPTLARRVRRMTGQRNIVTIPNAIDPTLFAPCPIPRDDRAAIVGWAGGTSHRADFAAIGDALARLARDTRVDLWLFGDNPLAASGIPHEHCAWSADVPEHYRRIGVLDIALAPLVDDQFNRSKSAVKWLEHAAHGTPMVLSPVTPYTEAAKDGATALFARTPREWYRQVRRLCTDRALREQIGQAARAEVLARHTTDQRVALYREVLGL